MVTYRLVDFHTANVITPMIVPPQPRLVVSGTKPDPAMEITLVPLAYVRRPEYWAVQTVGSTTQPDGQTVAQGPVPYWSSASTGTAGSIR